MNEQNNRQKEKLGKEWIYLLGINEKISKWFYKLTN